MKLEMLREVSPFTMLQLETCVRCAHCAEYCPVYDVLKKPQTMPGGRVSVMLKMIKGGASSWFTFYRLRAGKLNEIENHIKSVYECALCGRCMAVCPFGIQTDKLWELFRKIVYNFNKHPPVLKEVDKFILSTYNAYGVGNDARAMWVDYLGLDNVKINEPSDIVYFVGCTSSFKAVAQDIAYATSLTLNHAGVSWTLLGEDEWCCGAPLLMIGDEEGAKKMAEHNVRAIENLGARLVVSACPGCARVIKQKYPSLIGRALRFNVMHLMELLDLYIRKERISLKGIERDSTLVTYHDPCELARLSGVIDEPRRVINTVTTSFKEMPENRRDVRCCGGGGILQAVNDELRLNIAEKRVKQAKALEAEILTSACPACKITLMDGTKKVGAKIQVLDVVELFARRLGLM
ncbi:MAG: (Fe-S)-binding protein [Nitrososphaerota archaeon]